MANNTLEARIASLEKANGTADSIAVVYDDDPAPEDGAPFVRVTFVDAPSRDDDAPAIDTCRAIEGLKRAGFL